MTPGQCRELFLGSCPLKMAKADFMRFPWSDIAAFVFYYSEYTDIFVNYMDNQGSLAVH